MKETIKRMYGRRSNELRPLTLQAHAFGYGDGSVLLSCGDTKVLCTVVMQNGVPPFLRGKKRGWLTAEYALLPTASKTRRSRDTAAKRNGRSVEISRLIGRSLRTVVNLDLLGERTIFIDCDVLQADGGTRTLCITGAYAALKLAVEKWCARGLITETILTDEVAAVSVGCHDGGELLDLDFLEDSNIDADFNFVLTRSGKIIEIQGTAEKKGIAWESFNRMCHLATHGVGQLFSFLDATLKRTEEKSKQVSTVTVPLFSLKNRTTRVP